MNLTPETIEAAVEAQAHAFVAGMGVAVSPSDLRSLLNEVAESRARIEALEGALRRLSHACRDLENGRSIHNSRKPDQKIEGNLWNHMNAVLTIADRALLYERAET